MAAIVHNLVGLLHATMAVYIAWLDRAPALVLGATSEHPNEAAVHDLCNLAGGDREALKRALGRIEHPSEHVGHPRVIASLLLRSALASQDTLAVEILRPAGGV